MKYIKPFKQINELQQSSEYTYEIITNENELDKQLCIDMVANQFIEHMSYEDSVEYLTNVVNFDISFIAKKNDEVIGCLLLGESIIDNGDININITDDNINIDLSGKGLEGVALVIKPEFRKSLVIRKLLHSIYKLKQDYSYITIQQFKGMEETMNYFNKTTKIISGEYIDVFYRKL